MSHSKWSKATLPTLLALAIAGCGSEGQQQSDSSTTIVGHVADGYIQGATICIDVDESETCDAGEPQTVSVENGEYTLEVSLEDEGKPVLAEVPETAIDEDTGLAIGKELRLSTPGGKPDFISPLTTMVHQDLRDNPGRTIAQAHASVRASLGFTDEGEDDELFTDYIEASDSGDEDEQEKYRRMHQHGRAIAALLADIRTEVRAAADEAGLDLAGDKEARRAVGELVRQEARARAEAVAQVVNEKLAEIENNGIDNSNRSEALTNAFDPDEAVGNPEIGPPAQVLEKIERLRERRSNQ